MNIVIISQYLRDIENFDGNNNRFVYIAKLLAQNKSHSVEIITSNFNHSSKKHFDNVGFLENVKIKALHESGYAKNISLKRFYSHKMLAENIVSYLSQREKPDICYCAIPSLDVAYSVSRYCQNNGVRFIADIQDLWPEAFKMIFRVPVVSELLFFPMKKKADSIYRSADSIVAVSQTYAERALCVNKKIQKATVVYLGTEKDSFDNYIENEPLQGDEILVGYIGSMEASYDLITVIDAVAKLKDHPIKLLAMGDGSRKKAFIEYANEKGINAEFTGKLSYAQMVEQLMSCDIAVNPIHKDSAASIINKVGDYAMAGLPVINTQNSCEYRNLIDEYRMGLNCNSEDPDDVAEKLELLINNKQMRLEMGRNARRCGEENFDRKNSYKRIIELIEQ